MEIVVLKNSHKLLLICLVGLLLLFSKVALSLDPFEKEFTVFKVKSETVATTPSNLSRTTLGIGEEVNLSTDPATTVSWSVIGGGSVSQTSGSSTKFTASKSPSNPTIRVSVGSKVIELQFTVIAPISITSTKRADIGHGAVGPPNNYIGSYTTYDITVNLTTVSFYGVDLRENIPTHSWTWPDGTTGGIPRRFVSWSVGFANDTIDHISSGPYPINQIYKGTSYVSFDYQTNWSEDYENQAGGWIQFVANENRLTEYRGPDQKSRQTHMGAPGGWQGPWQ